MVSPDEFLRVWPLIVSGMEKDFGGGAYTQDEVWSEIDKGDAHLWTSENSCCLAEVVERNEVRFLNVYVVAGDLREIMTDIYPTVEQWARDNNCFAITGSGRDVWERVLLKQGFKPAYTTFVKEL